MTFLVVLTSRHALEQWLSQEAVALCSAQQAVRIAVGCEITGDLSRCHLAALIQLPDCPWHITCLALPAEVQQHNTITGQQVAAFHQEQYQLLSSVQVFTSSLTSSAAGWAYLAAANRGLAALSRAINPNTQVGWNVDQTYCVRAAVVIGGRGFFWCGAALHCSSLH